MKKRLLSIVLVIAMLLSMSTVAFATETSSDYTPVTFADDQSTIKLGDGSYIVDLYSVTARDSLTITGNGAGTKLVFSNLQVRASQFKTLTIENCTIERMPNKSWGHLVFGSSDNTEGVYTISNCIFNGVNSQGIYINENVSGATYNIKNCTFNGNFGGEGAITIQNNADVNVNVNVTGCKFNDVPETSNEIYVLYNNKGLNLTVDGKVVVDNAAMLADAIAKAEPGATVTLLSNAAGSGVVIDKDVTIDFGGYTYTFTGPAVGSSGTETLGFQILKNHNVTLKNGTLTSVNVTTANSKEIKVLIQNYANLTLTDMKLVDGTQHIQYALSNNCGVTELNGATSITTDAVAFDVYDYSSAGYSVPSVTVNTTGTIDGKIEVSKTATLTITGGTFTADPSAYVAKDYDVTEIDGEYVVEKLPSFTVNFVDGTIVYHTESVKKGTEIKAPAMSSSPAGYVFGGWNGFTTGMKADKDMTFTALWIENAVQDEIKEDLGENAEEILKDIETPVVDTKPENEIKAPTVAAPDGATDTEVKEMQAVANAVAEKVQEMEVTGLESAAVKETAKVVKEVQQDHTVVEQLQAKVGSETVVAEEIKVQPVVTVEVEVKEVKVEAPATTEAPATKTLVLDIKPMVEMKATYGDATVTVGEKKKLETENIAVEVTVPVPETFAVEGDHVTIVHTKADGRVFFYDAEVDADGNIKFINPNGFSIFAIINSSTVGELITDHYEVAFAYAYSKLAPYIPTVQGYLETLANAADVAADYVAAMDVPAQLVDTKAALAAELVAIQNTINELNDVLDVSELNAAEVNELFNSVLAHKDTIFALGDALGIVGLDAFDQLKTASGMVADWADDVYETAYNYLIDTDKNFKAEYDNAVAALVEEIAAISPELAAVVEEYLTVTPAAAMAYIADAGEQAYADLIAASLELSDDVNDFITAISAIIDLVPVQKMVEIMKTDVVRDALTIAAAAVEKYNEVMDMPVIDALQYEFDLAKAKNDLIAAQGALVGAVVNQMKIAVDPAVYAAAVEAWNQLCDLASDAAIVGGKYADLLGGHFDTLKGQLLTLIIDKTKDLGVVAGPIIDQMIWDYLTDVKEKVEDKIDEIVEIDVDLTEIKNVIADLKNTAGDIRAELNALHKYTTGAAVDADIIALENALESVEAYADKLTQFANDVEALAEEIDNAELSLAKAKAIIAMAKDLADDAEDLVNEALASVAVLAAIYEEVAPVIADLLTYVEDGSPVGIVIETAEEKIGALVETTVGGYDATVKALEAAATEIETVVTETLTAVCGTVADAVKEICGATDTAAKTIYDEVITAIGTIKTEALELAKSTDTEVRKAAEQIIKLVEAIELDIDEAEYEAKYYEAEAIVMDLLTAVDTAETIADLQAILDDADDVLTNLHDIAKQVYYIAQGDVITALNDDILPLVDPVTGIIIGAAGNIAGAAGTAATNSAIAINNAATNSIIAVNNAIDAYEAAVTNAIAIIVPVVTDAATAIGTQVAGVAAIASDAVNAAIEKAEELDAIVAALNNVVYDATHAEVELNCGEQLAIYGVYAEALAQAMNAVVAEDAADADVITVSFDGNGFINYMIAQIMGLAADEINDEITRNNLGSLLARFGADELIAEFIDLSQSYTAPDWTGFDADAIAAKNDMLVIIKNVLTEQGVPATYSEKLVNLLDMAKDMVDAETATLIADIQGIMNQDLDVEVPVIEILLDAAESVLYSYFTFAVEFPAELNAIRAAAPEAQVVVIGLSDAIAAALPEFADYITMVVDALNAHLFAYAAINTDTTYVADAAEIPAAITVTYADCVWGATTYEWVKVGNNWTCTATRVCTKNANHVETAEATITSAEKIPATTTEMGTTTYTATFDVEWATTQTKDVQDIAKLPSGPSGPVGGGGGGWRCTGGNHCPSCQFTDLAEVIKSNPRIWWHEYTDYVIKNKLMNGMTDTLFMPNYTTTRAMLVTILWREAGSPIVDAALPFEDVDANTWYTEAIRWAASKGIVDGMSDTEFAPNANITREQMVTIFYRYAKFNKVNVTTGNAKNVERFSDVDEISSWAYDAVKWACGIKFVDGKENNNIDPTGNATRVEMATLIMRFIENVM